MPVNIFRQGEKIGLRNSSGLIVVPPVYNWIEVFSKCNVGYKYLSDETIEIHYIDHSGNLIVNLNETLPTEYRGDIIEAVPLKKEFILITHRNWDSLEQFGITDSKGKLLIPPVYAGLELLPNGLIKSFHNDPYDEYNPEIGGLYGSRIHDKFGDLISDSRFIDYEEDGIYETITLEFQNGEFIKISSDGEILERFYK